MIQVDIYTTKQQKYYVTLKNTEGELGISHDLLNTS